MRNITRHTRWLAPALIMVFGLSGCFRSAGGSLEPTPVNVSVSEVDNTPIPTVAGAEEVAGVPSLTPIGVGPTAEEMTPPPTAIITERPTLIPTVQPSFTPIPTSADAAVDGQGGPATGPTATNTVTPGAVAFGASSTPIERPTLIPTEVPSSTPTDIPSATPTELPSATPTDTGTPVPMIPPTFTPVQQGQAAALVPTATFTSVPFNPPPASPTYTPFVPPGQQEAQPLAERPTETVIPVTVDGQGGPVEVAQGPTLSPNQATATALVFGATATAAAAQGTFLAPTVVPGQEGQVVTLIPTLQPGAPVVTPTPVGQCGSHLISPGETLYRIALQYNVTANQIAQANNLVNPDLIRAGDTLVIPCAIPPTATPVPAGGVADGQGGAAAPAQQSNVGGPITYIIEPGDNIYRLSLRFNVSMAAIMQANGLTPSTINFIYAGQQLYIPQAVQQVQPTAIPTAQPAQVQPAG
ncbi:MAG: LysM peptidoglycan-binding domain-containing protein [Anaerolineae bacterium]|nr:LysM peptidoglycan-binding domain-containing protein [Anaerolineae bacterium]